MAFVISDYVLLYISYLNTFKPEGTPRNDIFRCVFSGYVPFDLAKILHVDLIKVSSTLLCVVFESHNKVLVTTTQLKKLIV